MFCAAASGLPLSWSSPPLCGVHVPLRPRSVGSLVAKGVGMTSLVSYVLLLHCVYEDHFLASQREGSLCLTPLINCAIFVGILFDGDFCNMPSAQKQR